MRLPLLAAVGVVATLGIMTFDVSGASALTDHATVVTGAHGTAIVKRPLRTSTVVVKRPLRRSAMIVRRPLRARGQVIVRRPFRARGAVIVHHH